MSKHYDVIVLGASIGALATAALLARRSWRVLVLGQGWHPPTYVYDGIPIARRPFTFLVSSSPAWGRVLVELAQSQTFKRRITPLDPMFQVLAPRLRLEVPPDINQFGREIDREYAEVRRVVDELYAELARTNAAADAAFERDVIWPPGGFWERRETRRVASGLPHIEDAAGARSFLAEFPRDHDYRVIVETPAEFASHMTDLPGFAVARLHGAWTRGVGRLARGEQELVEFLADRVRAHGGDTRLSERAVCVLHKRGKVTGVLIDGDDQPTGVQFIVTDATARSLLALTDGFDGSRRVLAGLPELMVRERRFVVSITVRDEGIPEPLADESFLLADWPNRPLSAPIQMPAGAPRPRIHLQRWRSADKPGISTLVAEALLPDGTPLARAREGVLAVVEHFLPFVERHYLLIDSPHDGRPIWDFRSGARTLVDRSAARSGGGSLDAEPMAERWKVEPADFYGLAAEPIRAPLGGTFLVGPSTLPALGQEGELLAAWGAARLVTRTDRRKEKMRRDMWSKIELG